MTRLLLAVVLAQTVIAGADIFWLWRQHLRQLRMSRTDIKDETKETDGDPAIKMRIRRLRMRRARQRMLAAVPTATVVVTNPTHYAVALTYDTQEEQRSETGRQGCRFVGGPNPGRRARTRGTDRGQSTARSHVASVAARRVGTTRTLQGRRGTDCLCVASDRTPGRVTDHPSPRIECVRGRSRTDLNNFLTAIIGGAEAILERLWIDQETRVDITNIREGARRAGALIRDASPIPRETSLRNVISLNETILATSRLLAFRLGSDIALTLDLTEAGDGVRPSRPSWTGSC